VLRIIAFVSVGGALACGFQLALLVVARSLAHHLAHCSARFAAGHDSVRAASRLFAVKRSGCS